MRLALLAAFLLLLPTAGWGQPASEKGQRPRCTAQRIAEGRCVPPQRAAQVVVTDGFDSNDCVGGGGSVEVPCEHTGVAWGTDPFRQSTLGVVNVGSPSHTGVTIQTDGTGDGEVALPADSVGASELAPTVCAGFTFSFINPTEAVVTNDFMSLRDHSGSTNEANEQDFFFPNNFTGMADLYCQVEAAPTGATGWVIDLRDDAGAVPGGSNCIISGSGTNCQAIPSIFGSLATPAVGSRMNLRVVSFGPPAVAADELFCSICLMH